MIALAGNEAIGEAEQKGRAQQAAQMVLSGEAKTQAEAADRFDISRQAVSKALSTEKSQCDKSVDIPDHIAGNRNSQADFRKLSTTGQEQVRQGEPLNRVATCPGSLGDFFQQLLPTQSVCLVFAPLRLHLVFHAGQILGTAR